MIHPQPKLGRRSGAYIAIVLLAAAITLLFSVLCHAHKAGLSRGQYQLEGRNLQATIFFSHDDFIPLGRALGFADNWVQTGDTNNLGAELLKSITVLDAKGKPCPSQLVAAATSKDAIEIKGHFVCKSPGLANLDFRILERLPRRHRHAANGKLLTRDSQRFKLQGAADKVSHPSDFGGFLLSGVEHILFGFDHLVFLFGLVLVGRRWSGIIKAVTAFTVAHSITLALALLKIWAPSGRLVEPIIALSVAYVGIENFFVKDAEKRWRITLPFGLIHGFGFAGALGELALPAGELPTALFAFNLGVELGQLGVLCLLLPVLLKLHKRPWFADKDRGVRGLSFAIAAIGLFWFFNRVLG